MVFLKHCICLCSEVSSIQDTKLYTYKELKVATNDFSKSNKVGEGGFGYVYKVRSMTTLCCVASSDLYIYIYHLL